MIAIKQSEKQSILLARWLKRHQLMIFALLLSFGLHTVLLIPQQSTNLDIKTTVINARLTTEKAQGSTQQDQLPQKQKKSEPKALSKADPEPQKAEARQQSQVKQQKSAQRLPSDEPKTLQQNQDQEAVRAQTEIKKQKKGRVEEYSDPLERSYIQQLLTHLDQKIIAPEQLTGKVRLQISINYGQIVTQVTVITSSGNKYIDDWVVKAVLAANPFPQVPDKFSQPYVFRPTIDLGNPSR